MNLAFHSVRLPLARFTLEVDLRLTGRVTAVFGPSGAGKTTLLELVAGLRRPESGRIELSGDVLVEVASRIFVPPSRRRIGYVPQDGALFPHLSVRENLLYGHRSVTPVPAALTFAHVVEVLEIGGLLERRVPSLSGGEKQRVALGRALLSTPRLMLLDEPLAGLDAALKDRLMPYLQRVRDEFGIPMIYVTHAADEVVALCDDVLVLESGRPIRRGAPRALFEPATVPQYRLRPS